MSIHSKLIFGGASLVRKGKGYVLGSAQSSTSAQEFLERSLELGIRLYDVAPIYGLGEAETELGKFIKKRREELHVITKGGVGWHPSMRVNMSNDPVHIQSMLEDSLRRLNTDYIDTYLLHWPDAKVDVRYPLETLLKAKTSGKVLNVGLGNSHQADFEKALELTDDLSFQSEFNFFNQHSFDFTPPDSFKMGWATFAKGVLSGSVLEDRQFDPNDARSYAIWWKKGPWKEQARRVQEILEKFSFSFSDLKKFSLSKSISEGVHPIVGVSSLSQLEELVAIECTNVPEELEREFRL